MNNFEKIKLMKVDELAKFICEKIGYCGNCELVYECNPIKSDSMKKWLLKEYKDEQ